jgi:hypothetical protein
VGLTAIFIYGVYIALFIGSLYRPIFGVLGYLAVYLTYDPDIWWGITFRQYLPRPSIVAMSFLVLGSLIHIKKLKWSLSRREIELYLFLGSVWLSSLVFGIGMAPDNWLFLEKITKIFIFIFFFLRVVNSESNYKLVIWTFILAAVFLAIQAHTVSGDRFARGRLESLGGIDFHESNGLAAFMSIGMILLSTQMLGESIYRKVIDVIGIALMLNTIIMTQSRSIFVGLLIGGIYAVIRAPRPYRRQVYICLLLGLFLFTMLASKNFIERIETIQTGVATGQQEALRRLDFWKASLSIFEDYPMGVGIKNFEKIVPTYDRTNTGMDTHNAYVLCYCETGILGILLFLLIILEDWFQLRRINRIDVDMTMRRKVNLQTFGLATICAVYFVGYMMTHSNLYTEMLWILLALPICLENATRKLLDAKTSPAKDGTSKRAFSLWKKSTGRLTKA